MSETALTDHSEPPSMLLDGEAPRLATGPISAPAPAGVPTLDAPKFDLPPDAPTLPVVSPVLSAPAAPALPSPGTSAAPADLPAPDTSAAPAAPTEPDADADTSDSDHPMAHLMPPKTAASEASRRAAEKRAAKKAKAKKVKMGIIAGMLAFTVLVGPPLFKWLSNAINEAGSTGTTIEEPVEEPAD